jgi:hypothetical protein
MVGRNMSLKNLVTPPGIDPGAVRLVAQRLNHYAIPGTVDKDIRCQYTNQAVSLVDKGWSSSFRFGPSTESCCEIIRSASDLGRNLAIGADEGVWA